MKQCSEPVPRSGVKRYCCQVCKAHRAVIAYCLWSLSHCILQQQEWKL